MKKFCFFIITFLLAIVDTSLLFAQSDSLLILINDLSEEETYLNDLILELRDNPVNLNRADRGDLMEIPLITAGMADSIISRREKHGPFTSKRQVRPILGNYVYDLLKDFITASDKQDYQASLIQRNIYKIEDIPEIESGKFNGDAVNNYTRFHYQYNPYLSGAFVTQKDPGENNYLDHLNFAVQYKRRGWDIIFGNYNVLFGHGLSQSNPYGSSKSIFLRSVFREYNKFGKSNLSSSESTGKFGLFTHYSFSERGDVFAFYSKTKKDVQLTDNFVTGLRIDGYHRSESEINSAERLTEDNAGVGLSYKIFQSFRLSFLYNAYSFDPGFNTTIDVLGENQKRRQFFSFNGNQLSQISLAYAWQLSRLRLSAEYSSSDQGGPGWVQSAYFVHDDVDIGIKYWYLSRDFQTVDGRSFDNSTAFPQGVSGYFAGIRFKVSSTLFFSGFKQFEKDLWRSYFDPLPTESSDWLTQLDWEVTGISSSLRFRHRQSDSFEETNSGQERIFTEQNNIRLQFNFNPSKALTLKSRLEHVFIIGSHEKGTLFFQDFTYNISRELTLNSRWTFFNTGSYDTRIYEYEYDLPGTFSNIALYENGNKTYLLLKWSLLQNMEMWLKWRYIIKYNHVSGGNFYRDINRELRAQIRFKF